MASFGHILSGHRTSRQFCSRWHEADQSDLLAVIANCSSHRQTCFRACEDAHQSSDAMLGTAMARLTLELLILAVAVLVSNRQVPVRVIPCRIGHRLRAHCG